LNKAVEQQLAAGPRERLGLSGEPDFPRVSSGRPIPALDDDAITALPENERLAYLRGSMDGFKRGHDMSLEQQHQRSLLLHAVGKVSEAQTLEEAQEITNKVVAKVIGKQGEDDAAEV
jgi:hypothetical protein